MSSRLAHAVFEPIFVPVLRHGQLNLDILETTLVAKFDGASHTSYGGLIITSQRTVEVLSSVLPRVPPSIRSKLLSDTKVYVVGPATARAVVGLGFPSSNVIGHGAGNGEALAEFILEDYDARPRPLLFLAGETRRDIIPKALSAAQAERRITVEELVVYETTVDEGFEREFEKAIKETDGVTRWIVLFSPAGADVAVRVLGEHLPSEGSFLAAIGPTTGQHLANKLERRPDVVAEKPSPSGLWKGIKEFMEQEVG
jgi:uroporphyrinogen-III synthase